MTFRANFKMVQGKLYHCTGMVLYVTDDYGNAVKVPYPAFRAPHFA